MVDDPALPDGMRTAWPAPAVAGHVAAAVDAFTPGLVRCAEQRALASSLGLLSELCRGRCSQRPPSI